MKHLTHRLCATALMLTLFIGCAINEETRTQKASGTPMAQYQTYRWLDQEGAKALDLSNPDTSAPAYYWVRVVDYPEKTAKVRKVVEKDLQEQGFKEATGVNPDFYVTYYARSSDGTWLSSWTGATPGLENVPLVMYPDFNTSAARTYRDGMAMIVVYDAHSKKPVWQGSVLHALSGNDTVNRDELIAQIDQLIAKFRKTA